jgi:hypothetical protein
MCNLARTAPATRSRTRQPAYCFRPARRPGAPRCRHLRSPEPPANAGCAVRNLRPKTCHEPLDLEAK